MGVIYYDGDAARTRESILAGLGAIRGVDPAHPALRHLETAAAQCFANRLRASPRNATIRDNRLGILQAPVGAFDSWAEDEARFYLDRVAWCAAVRLRNLEGATHG